MGFISFSWSYIDVVRSPRGIRSISENLTVCLLNGGCHGESRSTVGRNTGFLMSLWAWGLNNQLVACRPGMFTFTAPLISSFSLSGETQDNILKRRDGTIKFPWNGGVSLTASHRRMIKRNRLFHNLKSQQFHIQAQQKIHLPSNEFTFLTFTCYSEVAWHRCCNNICLISVQRLISLDVFLRLFHLFSFSLQKSACLLFFPRSANLPLPQTLRSLITKFMLNALFMPLFSIAVMC